MIKNQLDSHCKFLIAVFFYWLQSLYQVYIVLLNVRSPNLSINVCSIEHTDSRVVLVLMAQKLLLCHSYSLFVVRIRRMEEEWRRRRGDGTRGVFGVVHNAPLWVSMAGWWCHGWQGPKPTELVKARHDWSHRRVSDIVVWNQAMTEGSSPFSSYRNTTCQSVSYLKKFFFF